MKKILLPLILILIFMFSCVSETNNSTESKESILLKKVLSFLNFEQSILNRVEKENKFVKSSDEQLTPSSKFKKKFNVDTKKIHNRNVYIISPQIEGSNTTILYLHGGAYMANFLPIHWDFIGKLIEETGVTIIAPDYPLAPEATWESAFHMLEAINDELLIHNEDILFMGDSAGAGLALAWTMELNRRQLNLPKRLVLLSPWLDISMENPDITATDELDPYLSRKALQIAGNYWAGNIGTTNWQVSPINGNLKGLPPITLFSGTADILNPDAQLLNNKMLESEVTLDYREYEYMIHDWMFFKMPEADKCLNEIVDLLNS